MGLTRLLALLLATSLSSAPAAHPVEPTSGTPQSVSGLYFDGIPSRLSGREGDPGKTVHRGSLAEIGVRIPLAPVMGPSTNRQVTALSVAIRGTATWYCGAGSPCTAGYSPSELIAAIDPTTGIEKGERVTVWHGDRSVTVRVIDVCQCPGERIIDLSRIAFSRLADPSQGIIGVVLAPARGSAGAQPRMTLPPTDTSGGNP